MQRAIDLAELGKNEVSPNPRVGAVIVYQDKIIGEGYHQRCGEAHAEVNAIASVKDPSLLKHSSIYVNLEPCSHHGKTPPCADLILKHQIPRVVIANQDPFEAVAGKGIKKLKDAGVEVVLHVLQEKGEELNKRFFTFHRKQRPYIILKWAETQDGFIGRLPEDPHAEDNWITNAVSKQLVHLWRAEEDGILVGKNTVLQDDPLLTCREVEGINPKRLLIDAKAELDINYRIFNEEADTFVLNEVKAMRKANLSWHQCSLGDDLLDSVDQLLYEQGIQSLIVEGGANLLQQFIKAEHWDEARIFVGEKEFGMGIKAPSLDTEKSQEQAIQGDTLRIYFNERS